MSSQPTSVEPDATSMMGNAMMRLCTIIEEYRLLLQKILSDDGAGPTASCVGGCVGTILFSKDHSKTENTVTAENISSQPACTRGFVSMNRSYLSTIAEESLSSCDLSWCPSSRRVLRNAPLDEDEMEVKDNINILSLNVEDVNNSLDEHTPRFQNGSFRQHDSCSQVMSNNVPTQYMDENELTLTPHSSGERGNTFWPMNYLSVPVALTFDEGIYEELMEEHRQPRDTMGDEIMRNASAAPPLNTNYKNTQCSMDSKNAAMESMPQQQRRQQPEATSDDGIPSQISPPSYEDLKSATADRVLKDMTLESQIRPKHTASFSSFWMNLRSSKNSDKTTSTKSIETNKTTSEPQMVAASSSMQESS